MKLINRIPLIWLAVIAGWLAIAPISPEPHLIEKFRMLSAGTLVRPIDIFDLLLHSVPLLILFLRLLGWYRARRE
jgi:hypothetical protein